MLVRFLAPAALAGLVLTTAIGPTQAVAQQAMASDSVFIQKAASLGLLQAKLGKLAQEKGSSDVVRDFGKRMVADYSKANEELAAGAKQAAYPRPVLLRPHQQIFDRFNSMGRSAFDKSYMAEMVSEHDDMATFGGGSFARLAVVWHCAAWQLTERECRRAAQELTSISQSTPLRLLIGALLGSSRSERISLPH
jgi:putative membrane protein